MRIVIDMQGMQSSFSGQRGVGRYTEQVALALHKAFPQFDYQYVFNAAFADGMDRCRSRLHGLLTPKNTQVFTHLNYRGWRWSGAGEIRVAREYWAAFIASLRPDIFFCPNLQEGLDEPAITASVSAGESFCQVSTLHDLVPFHYDEYLADPVTRRWYESKIRDAVAGEIITTVSEYSRLEICALLGVAVDQVVAAPNGYDSALFSQQGDKAADRRRTAALIADDMDFILYLGGADPHKNLGRLIDAYALLPSALRSRRPLLIAGSGPANSGEVAAKVEQHGLTGSVRLLGFVDDEAAAALMRRADLFVVPSTHEGFGLPAVEAMACGAPTIGSANSAVAEVIDRSEALFDPLDERAIASLLEKGLTDRKFNQSLRSTGAERARSFSWDKTAHGLVGAFHAALERKRSEDRLTFTARRLNARRLSGFEGWSTEDMARDIALSFPDETEPTIYLDLSSVAVHGGNTGIQRVSRAIAAALPKAVSDFGYRVDVIAWDSSAEGFRRLDHGLQLGVTEGDLIDLSPSDIFVFLDLHPGVAIDTEAAMQRARMIGVRVCHVVYDILPALMPDKFWPDLCSQFRQWLMRIARSDRLICISDTVAHQTAKYLEDFGPVRATALEIDSFRLGSDIDPIGADAASAPLVAGEYFLVVSTLEPRKAHAQTLAAFERLWARGRNFGLVFVGKAGWSVEDLTASIEAHPEKDRRLHWFRELSDFELDGLYAGAVGVIVPSLGEGFGLPIVEAAAHGIPVIARDIPVFREVAGDGAFYFNDDPRPEVIADAVDQWDLNRRGGKLPDERLIRPISWKDSAAEFANAILKPVADYTVWPRGAYMPGTNLLFETGVAKWFGLYDREENFRWTMAESSATFSLARAIDNSELHVEFRSWRSMAASIRLDGQLIWAGKASTKIETVCVPVGIIDEGEHRLSITSDAAPASATDPRILGLAVQSLRLTS